MTFSIFFQRLTFPANTCQRLRCIQNPVEHSTMELYCEIFFFAKLIRKHLCWSLILIKLQVSILQLHWKKGLQHRCFQMNGARYLIHHFYRSTPRDCFCSVEKYFINKIRENPLRKEKMETPWKKNNDTCKTKT